MTVGMEVLTRRNVFVLNLLSLYGMVLGQHIQCPTEDWTVGSNITLRCYLPKSIYPSQCTFGFTDEVKFYKDPLSPVNTKCTLSTVSTSSCSSSSSECSCESDNSTYYSLQSTFTVNTGDAGTWGCTVSCIDNNFDIKLPYISDTCKDKNVVEPTTPEPPTTTTPGAAPPTPPDLVLTITISVGGGIISISITIYCCLRHRRRLCCTVVVNFTDKGMKKCMCCECCTSGCAFCCKIEDTSNADKDKKKDEDPVPSQPGGDKDNKVGARTDMTIYENTTRNPSR